MADGWDDWGDGDDNQSHNSEKSEGWDWPAEEGSSAAAVIPATTRTSPSVAAESNSRTEDAEAKARTARAVNEMTDKFFSELRRYQEDLADPCVREEINKVREAVTAKAYFRCISSCVTGRTCNSSAAAKVCLPSSHHNAACGRLPCMYATAVQSI